MVTGILDHGVAFDQLYRAYAAEYGPEHPLFEPTSRSYIAY